MFVCPPTYIYGHQHRSLYPARLRAQVIVLNKLTASIVFRCWSTQIRHASYIRIILPISFFFTWYGGWLLKKKICLAMEIPLELGTKSVHLPRYSLFSQEQ